MPEFIDRMKQVSAHFTAAHALLAKGPLDYYFAKLIEHSEALMALCPVQVGDRVVVAGEIPIPSGWKSSSKSLAIGSAGVIKSVDYIDGDYLVEFKPDRQLYQVGDRWVETETQYVYPVRPNHLVQEDGKEV